MGNNKNTVTRPRAGCDIKLIIYSIGQDSPKKCTAKKLLRFKYAIEITNLYKLPFGTVLLSPYSKKSLSLEDLDVVKKAGL